MKFVTIQNIFLSIFIAISSKNKRLALKSCLGKKKLIHKNNKFITAPHYSDSRQDLKNKKKKKRFLI